MHSRISTAALSCFFLLSLGLSACSTAPASESEATVLKESLAADFSIKLLIPSNTAVGDATIAASGAINAGDRDQLGGQIASAAGPITLGNDAVVGEVVSGGNVLVRDRVTVASIVAKGTVTLGSSDRLGSSSANASVPTTTVSWTVSPPPTSNGDITLQPGAQAAPVPGAYGALVANSRSSVLLQAGTYFFSGIDLEPQATLFVDSSQGPVIVYVTGPITYRGAIQSTTSGLPRLFVGYLGTSPVTLSAPFTGVFFAPSADVNLNPGNSVLNRATLYGKNITLQPSAVIKPMPFDFTVFGLPPNPKTTGPRKTIFGPKPAVNLTSNLPSDATGNATSSANPGTPTVFTLPPSFPVAAGDIANGTVTIRFTPPGGSAVTCTYQGGASSATPTANADFEAGRILHFVSCSNGAAAGSSQVGTNFTMTVNRTSTLPVTVSLPFDQNACGHEFDILSPTDTFNMRTSFNWSQHQTPVAQNNTDGTPALYYAWVYVETREHLLQLRKLYVDVLSRPLFDSELAQFAGLCGTFRNPGDGHGIFVPVVMPGLVYNKLLEVQTASNISGNRFPFDAVIIRSDFPAGAKNANGSISYAALRNANYRYLNAQPGQPLPSQAAITLDGHDISAALTDAFTFVADAVQDIGRQVTNALGTIVGLFTGTVNMDLRILALNVDPQFNDSAPLTRGWGAKSAIGNVEQHQAALVRTRRPVT